MTTLRSSVAELDADEWDALVRDGDFFHSHRWLRGLDDALGPAELLTVSEPAGVTGGCALWDGEEGPGLFYLPDFFAGLPGPWHERFLWVGARRAMHNELPAARGSRRRLALGAILASALRLASERRLAGIVVPYMPLVCAREAASTCDGACVVLHSAEAVQYVPPGGFAEMLASWRSHDRVRTNTELAAFARFGNRAEETPLTTTLIEPAVRLIAATRAKYHSPQGEGWLRRLFDGQRRAGLLDQAIAMVARRDDGRMAGISVSYRFGRMLHLRYFGSDYGLTEHDFRYFTLCYYLPPDYAARQGLRQICLSISALEAKARRGALVEPLAALVAFTGGVTLSPDIVSRHNEGFAQALRRQLPSRLGPDWALAST